YTKAPVRMLGAYLLKEGPLARLHGVDAVDSVRYIPILVEANRASHTPIHAVLYLINQGRSCDFLTCLDDVLHCANQHHRGIIRPGAVAIYWLARIPQVIVAEELSRSARREGGEVWNRERSKD